MYVNEIDESRLNCALFRVKPENSTFWVCDDSTSEIDFSLSPLDIYILDIERMKEIANIEHL